jgi:hypothetical protein
MTVDKRIPGFTAEQSLKRSSDDYSEKGQNRGSTKRLVTPQGCCISGPFGICLVSSPLCP